MEKETTVKKNFDVAIRFSKQRFIIQIHIHRMIHIHSYRFIADELFESVSPFCWIGA